MSTSPVSTFLEAVEELSASCRRVPPEEIGEALEAVVEPPAVGVPLPFDGISLDGMPVATDWNTADLAAAATGVTPAGLAVAAYGTVTVRSGGHGDELVALYPDRHVAVVHADDVVPDMTAAFERLGSAFEAGDRTHVLATGPSATADMGGLIQGVHGPLEVHVVVIEP